LLRLTATTDDGSGVGSDRGVEMVRQREREQERVAAGASGLPRHTRTGYRARAHTSRNVEPTKESGNGKHAPAIRRILVPLDGSPVAESVLPMIEALARRLNASVVLFRAVTPPAVTGPMPEALAYLPDVVDFLEADVERYLGRIADDLTRKGLEVSTRVTVESPVSGIVNAAGDVNADLVALATHGRSGLARWIMGSTADAVVRSGLPCLIVRAGDGAR
jgi:nucleotide-binding universal stress UspA family protein